MELTGRDVRAIVRALQPAVEGKIQKVYGTDRFTLVLDLYARDLPYRYLYVELPSLLFVSNDKVEMPSKPTGLAQRIRGQLQGLKIAAIEQHGMDRIVIFRLVGRTSYSLVIELFSKGNALVLDEQGVIKNLAIRESFGSRDVRPGAVYAFPPTAKLDPDSLEFEQGKHLIAQIAAAGFGGQVAERILEPFVSDVSSATIEDLKDPEALKTAIIAERDATLFRLEGGRLVADDAGMPILDLLAQHADLEPAPVGEERERKRVSKGERAIEIQSKRVDELKDRREDDLRRGEVLFEQYALFEEILAFCREYRAAHGSLKGLDDAWPGRFPKLLSVSGVSITLDVESVK